jgi:hypothetical protein
MKLLGKIRLRPERRNEFESQWLRDYFFDRYQISIGLYSYGCFDASRIPRGTTIGRYGSFACSAQLFNGNHGIDFLALHPYLYNVRLGLVEQETIVRLQCVIEDDVWLGHSCVVLPAGVRPDRTRGSGRCRRRGDRGCAKPCHRGGQPGTGVALSLHARGDRADRIDPVVADEQGGVGKTAS